MTVCGMQSEFEFFWTTQWITCFLSTGHHPGTVNSQKYLCNPSSDIEIKWLHKNFNEAHFWGVWDNLNFHWFNGHMTCTHDDINKNKLWYHLLFATKPQLWHDNDLSRKVIFHLLPHWLPHYHLTPTLVALQALSYLAPSHTGHNLWKADCPALAPATLHNPALPG